MSLADVKNNYEGLEQSELIDLIYVRDGEIGTLIEKVTGYEKDLVEAGNAIKELRRILNLRNQKIFGSTSEKQKPTAKAIQKDYINYEEIKKEGEKLPGEVTSSTTKEKRHTAMAIPGAIVCQIICHAWTYIFILQIMKEARKWPRSSQSGWCLNMKYI